MSSTGDWDDASINTKNSRSNLFSKWRHRDRGGGTTSTTTPGGGGGGGDGGVAYRDGSTAYSKHMSVPRGMATAASSSSASRASRTASASSGLAGVDDASNGDIGGSTRSSTRRHRSRSRPEDRDRGGDSESATSRPKSRSRGDRHRSKSRNKSRTRDRAAGRSAAAASATDGGEGSQPPLPSSQPQPPPSRGIVRDESLRDYWKRRAEESKERVGGASNAAAGSSAAGSSWGEKIAIAEEEINATANGGRRSRGSADPPPPPPRGDGGGGRRRPKSRGRDRDRGDQDASSVVSTSSNNHRRVDSIASALVGHARKGSGTPGAQQTPHRSRSQASSGTPYAAEGGNVPSSALKGSSSSHNNHAAAEDLSSLSPLHHSLATASWPALHSHIAKHARPDPKPSEIAALLSVPHPREGGTVLHVACWKAPPMLAVQMMRLMPRESREMSVLLGIRDGEGNTPLHLCCGNLDWREDYARGGGKDAEMDPLAVLREIVRRAPPRAWTVQNTEGDTPLHMLVSSPLCCADWRSSSSSLLSSMTARAKLASEALQLPLPSKQPSYHDNNNGAIGFDACLLQERTGATPLHVALASGAHDCVIESLLAAHPDAARTKDARGMFPLHWAAAFGRASYAAVKRLAEEYPMGLTSTTVDGDIPLHLAVSNAMMEEEAGSGGSSGGRGEGSDAPSKVDKNRLKIVELLMHDHRKNASSNSDDTTITSPILTTNREKLTPLHCCALFDAPPQISKLLMKHPDANAASSTTNSFGATPLHLAAAQPGVSQSIATVLAIGSPDAAAVQDRLKRTPLHVAAQNTYATNLLIKTLAELNPHAAAVKTQRGHLPLHLAAQSQAKEAVIRALIKAYPAAAEARNKSNNTPLHDAAKYRASLGAVRLLLDAYPGALYVQNQYGNLPLHCATAYQAPSEVVQLLLKSWPEGASMQNRNQDAPLHYAAAYATSVHAVRPLIEAAPAAVLLLNSSGQSPVDRAKANNAPAEIVKLLETAADEYSRNASSGDGSWASFGQQPGHGEISGKGSF